MRDRRPGEGLWMPWDGDHSYILNEGDESQIVYYTIEHVDVDNEVVRRALASAIQRDGIADSLADGFRALEGSSVIQGHAGSVDGEIYMSTCDEEGITEYGDRVDEITDITWVQIKSVL